MLFLCLSSTEDCTQNAPDNLYLDKCLFEIANGNKEALADLYNETSTGVYAFALSILKNAQDAEDVLHDCFVRIYSSAGSYTTTGKPMAWILTIAKNMCFGKIRAQKRYADNEVEDWQGALSANENLQVEDKMVLAACFEHLSDEERNILVLYAVSGFKHREIASMLNISLSTVLSKYHRALKKLRNHIAKGEELS